MELLGFVASRPRSAVRRIGEREHELRQREAVEQPPIDPERVRALLRDWAELLELNLVLATIGEAAVLLRPRSVRELVERSSELAELISTLCRLDVLAVLKRAGFSPPQGASAAPPDDSPLELDPSGLVRSAKSLLLHYPERQLRSLGEAFDPELAFRCTQAAEGLRAFVARHEDPNAEALRVAGHAYAEGRLSIDEVAGVLGLSIPDALVLLEGQGYFRSVAQIRLTPDQEAARYEAIRRDRLARAGRPVRDDALVAREVIASQRIEGIDARPWLAR